MKRFLWLPWLAALCLFLLAGCGSPAQPEVQEVGIFTAENNIFTYEKIDPARTQLVVSRTGNIYIKDFLAAFEEANPDIQCIYVDITGGDSITCPLLDWIKNGCGPDVSFADAGFFIREEAAQLFEDLSGNPNVANYSAEALAEVAVDGRIYCFPGPSNLTCMIYNKTLFAQYGWQTPRTFDEFVALCLQIREDTNGTVQPWNPNAKYSNEFCNVTEAFVYPEVFGGVENRTWYHAFTQGQADYGEHMGPYYNCLQTLVDNGLLTEEHFSYSATTRGQEFAQGQIAMVNMNIADYDNDAYDFGYMPIPTTQGEIGYLCNSFSCQVGVVKKEYTEAQWEAIGRLLTFFSSVAGQQAFIGKSLMVSNVKGVPIKEDADLAALQPALAAGHVFQRLEFEHSQGLRVNFSLTGHTLSLLRGEKTAAECMAAVDAAPYLPPEESAKAPPAAVGSAAADFSVLETSFLLADGYRAIAGAEIGLIAHNADYRGNLMRIFAGELNTSNVTTLKPRSFANDSTLVKVAMTGRQLLDALNHPYGNDAIADCIYAYSGLCCQVAPWNPLGQRYLSVTLADGTALDPAQVYTVAIWQGTVFDQYITEVLEAYEGSFEQLFTAWLQKVGPLAPAEDGRIHLVWETAQ